MFRDHPAVCLVTDRRRLVDSSASFESGRRALVALAHDAAAAGISLIQVRERELEAASLADLVAAMVAVTRGSQTRVVVNDRLDVALTSGADGVHLRGGSISPVAARALAPAPFLIGRSVHSIQEARDHAESVDYLIAGTVFPTSSKPASARCLSQQDLRGIVAAVSRPVLAIGGITLERLSEVASAGVAGIAAIGLFAPGGVPLHEIVQSVRTTFDSVRAAS